VAGSFGRGARGISGGMTRTTKTRVAALSAAGILALAATACSEGEVKSANHPRDESIQTQAVTAEPASPPPPDPVVTSVTTAPSEVEQAGRPVEFRIGTGGATLLPIGENRTRITVSLGGDPTVRAVGIYSGSCGGRDQQTAAVVPLEPLREGRSDTEAERGLQEIVSGQHVLVIHESNSRQSGEFECEPIPDGQG